MCVHALKSGGVEEMMEQYVLLGHKDGENTRKRGA